MKNLLIAALLGLAALTASFAFAGNDQGPANQDINTQTVGTCIWPFC